MTRIYDSLVQDQRRDPAGYVIETFPEVRDRFDKARRLFDLAADTVPTEPVEAVLADIAEGQRIIADAVRANLEMQAYLGIPRNERRVTTERQARNLLELFVGRPPEEVRTAVQQIERVYGNLATDVLREVANLEDGLDPKTRFLIPLVNDPTAFAIALNGIRDGAKARGGLAEKGDLGVIRAQVVTELADVAEAFMAGAPGGARVGDIAALYEFVTDAAVVQRVNGQSIEDAVRTATRALVLNTLYVGEPIAGRPPIWAAREIRGRPITPVQFERIREGLRALVSTDQLEDFRPAPLQGGDPRLDDESRRQALIAAAVSDGYWVTREDGTGAFFVVPLARAEDELGVAPVVALVNENGERYEVDYLDLLESAPLRAAQPGFLAEPGGG